MSVAALSTSSAALTASPSQAPATPQSGDTPGAFARLVSDAKADDHASAAKGDLRDDVKTIQGDGKDSERKDSDGTENDTPVDLLAKIEAMVTAAGQLTVSASVPATTAPIVSTDGATVAAPVAALAPAPAGPATTTAQPAPALPAADGKGVEALIASLKSAFDSGDAKKDVVALPAATASVKPEALAAAATPIAAPAKSVKTAAAKAPVAPAEAPDAVSAAPMATAAAVASVPAIADDAAVRRMSREAPADDLKTIASPLPGTTISPIATMQQTSGTSPVDPGAGAGANVQPSPADQSVTRHLDLARDHQWLDRLARDISQAATHQGHLKFQLSPANLGAMTVEVANSVAGTAIRFATETDHARTIIADAQPRLIAEIQAQGLRVAESHVDLNRQGGGSSSMFGQGQTSGQQGQASEDRKPFASTQAFNRDDAGDSASRDDGELYA